MENNKVKVSVYEGKLIGIVEKDVYNNSYIAFRGIPYAKPPIGELRFKDPVPAEPWTGDRNASVHGNVAVQLNSSTGEIMGDEDCLYLNVYTTKLEPSKKRSVMVWIHGGAFSMGSGDATFYGPDYIVQKDVVLVTLNYRLGVLGFLNLYDKVATGNQALKDVVMALRWVKKNISVFGGDSENVTIFGESAGGVIVHYLTLSPLAKGLFHKAISQSGVMACPWAFTEREPHTKNRGFLLAEKLGKPTTDPKVAYEFLKTIDAKTLIEKSQEKSLLSEAERQQCLLTFTPTLDYESSNPAFPENLTTFIHCGVNVPLLLGFTSCEGSLFICSNFMNHTSKEELKKIDSDFKMIIMPKVLSTLSKIPMTVKELRSIYFGDKAVSEETLINYANFIGDQFFYRSIMEVTDIQTELNNTDNNATYLYKFSYENENNFMRKLLNITLPGVSHGEDLSYLFYPNMMKDLGLSPPAPDSEDYKMINCLTQMWTDFAKTGNPTPITNFWLPVTSSRKGNYNYLNIDKNSQMKIFRKGEERWNWEEKKNKLQY
ncbi:hypothetical protein P5V15_011474 [Pogonomyrmex californicus]